jgi:hypothetical protein
MVYGIWCACKCDEVSSPLACDSAPPRMEAATAGIMRHKWSISRARRAYVHECIHSLEQHHIAGLDCCIVEQSTVTSAAAQISHFLVYNELSFPSKLQFQLLLHLPFLLPPYNLPDFLPQLPTDLPPRPENLHPLPILRQDSLLLRLIDHHDFLSTPITALEHRQTGFQFGFLSLEVGN